MSPSEIIAIVGSIVALILSVGALVKAHEKPIVIADQAINKVQADPVLLNAVEGLIKSFPPDTLKILGDAGLLVNTIATGAQPPHSSPPPAQPQPGTLPGTK